MNLMDTTTLPAPLKVFIVEESPLVRRRIAAMLGGIHGVAIVGAAEDPLAAIEGIAVCGAELAFVDLRLAGGSGLDLLTAISQRALPVVTIVFTNHSGPQFRSACLAAGAHYFFDKTTEYDAARATVERLARSRLALANLH
jgi:DNA-binding NarL/FixJ family response regulator